MFTEYFKFRSVPFTKGIPPVALFVHSELLELHNRFKFCVLNNKFAVVTGVCGTGKTTAIRRFDSSLDKSKYVVLYISQSSLNARGFYRIMLDKLGIQARRNIVEAKKQLQEQLYLMQHVKNIHPVCIIDESHLLSYDMLEEIRFLLNMQFDSISPVSLILAGQPELLTKLQSPKCEAINQRIDIIFHLKPFDLTTTNEYIKHQLKYAGAKNDIFTEKAISDIHVNTSGVARRIDKVCTNCLIYASQKKINIIDDHVVNYVSNGEFM